MTNRELQNALRGWPGDYEMIIIIENINGDKMTLKLEDMIIYPHMHQMALTNVKEE